MKVIGKRPGSLDVGIHESQQVLGVPHEHDRHDALAPKKHRPRVCLEAVSIQLNDSESLLSETLSRWEELDEQAGDDEKIEVAVGIQDCRGQDYRWD